MYASTQLKLRISTLSQTEQSNWFDTHVFLTFYFCHTLFIVVRAVLFLKHGSMSGGIINSGCTVLTQHYFLFAHFTVPLIWYTFVLTFTTKATVILKDDINSLIPFIFQDCVNMAFTDCRPLDHRVTVKYFFNNTPLQVEALLQKCYCAVQKYY